MITVVVTGNLADDRARSAQLTPEGVTLTVGAYTPTEVCDQGLADKLGIPGGYRWRLRAEQPGLYDANVNGWLSRSGRRYSCPACADRPAGGRRAGVRGMRAPRKVTSGDTRHVRAGKRSHRA